MRCIDDLNRVAGCPVSGATVWDAWPFLIFGLATCLILCWFVFWPVYNVWRSRKEGEADLAQAQFEQRIQVAEAQGRLDAAAKNKEAAIIEAEAVAAQIKTIGDQLTSHDLYLRWQWIEMMKHGGNATIYVPTEAGLPILEAGKRPTPP